MAEAPTLGADAVVGIDPGEETVGGSMLRAGANSAAVRVA